MKNKIEADDKQKRTRWYKCPDCGHVWRSYSTGQRVSCPACYERATGRKRGQNAEHMAEMRAKKAAKYAEPPQEQQNTEVPGQTDLWDFLPPSEHAPAQKEHARQQNGNDCQQREHDRQQAANAAADKTPGKVDNLPVPKVTEPAKPSKLDIFLNKKLFR